MILKLASVHQHVFEFAIGDGVTLRDEDSRGRTPNTVIDRYEI